MRPIQVESIILPTRVSTLGAQALGTEVENINDLLEHTSIEFLTRDLEYKTITILVTESIVGAGVPGNLWCWVELSPVPSTVSALYWGAIGGGGGAQPPIAPTIEAAVGVHLTQHTIVLTWTDHSPYARLVMQTPVAAGLPGAIWVVQASFMGRG